MAFTEAGYIDMAIGGLVKGYGCEVVTVKDSCEFWEV